MPEGHYLLLKTDLIVGKDNNYLITDKIICFPKLVLIMRGIIILYNSFFPKYDIIVG